MFSSALWNQKWDSQDYTFRCYSDNIAYKIIPMFRPYIKTVVELLRTILINLEVCEVKAFNNST